MRSYGQAPPNPEDFAKEPPVMPPHLQLTLLNVPPALDATASLPRPQHVILNHLYIQRSSQLTNSLVVGTTHRRVQHSLLTVSPALGPAIACQLPCPDSRVCCRSLSRSGTCRYRSKYVTCVMYKPRKRHQLSESEPMESSPRVQ